MSSTLDAQQWRIAAIFFARSSRSLSCIGIVDWTTLLMRWSVQFGCHSACPAMRRHSIKFDYALTSSACGRPFCARGARERAGCASGMVAF